jgi:hypothetical protein
VLNIAAMSARDRPDLANRRSDIQEEPGKVEEESGIATASPQRHSSENSEQIIRL